MLAENILQREKPKLSGALRSGRVNRYNQAVIVNRDVKIDESFIVSNPEAMKLVKALTKRGGQKN